MDLSFECHTKCSLNKLQQEWQVLLFCESQEICLTWHLWKFSGEKGKPFCILLQFGPVYFFIWTVSFKTSRLLRQDDNFIKRHDTKVGPKLQITLENFSRDFLFNQEYKYYFGNVSSANVAKLDMTELQLFNHFVWCTVKCIVYNYALAIISSTRGYLNLH